MVSAWLQKTWRPAPRNVRLSQCYTVRVGDMRVSVWDAAALVRVQTVAESGLVDRAPGVASEPGASSAEVMPSAGLRDIRTTDLLRRAQPDIATKPSAIGMYLPGSSATLKLPL